MIREKSPNFETHRCGKWFMCYYPDTKELRLICPNRPIIIIKLSTYRINSVPKYVMEYMEKNHILDFWKETQKQKALDGLMTVRKRIEQIKENIDPKTWIETP